MLTQASFPTWFNLFRALFRRAPPDAVLASAWHRNGEVAGWLSRSTWSLALIALWRRRSAPESTVTVWVPDFFCNVSLTALRAAGVKLVFYALTDELMPDIAACKSLLTSQSVDLFVLVHYFGRSVPAAPTRDFCAQNGAWLIEDAAHVLRPAKGIGDYGDFVVYSPHKHLPIPNGAVLVVRGNGPSRLTADQIASYESPSRWPRQLRELQEVLGCSIGRSLAHAAIWLVKRLLQKIGMRFGGRFQSSYFEPPPVVSVPPEILDAPPLIGLSRRLLPCLLSDLETIAEMRKHRESLWDAILLSSRAPGSPAPLTAERSADKFLPPYLAAYRVAQADAEETYVRLARTGFPVSTWPDLPPEVSSNRGNHSNAWSLRHSCFYLPVHQSLDELAMVRLRSPRKNLRHGDGHIDLVWDDSTRLQWQAWEARAARSNLMQNWEYGDAKSGATGWRVRRGVFYLKGERIAIVQLLQKRIAGMLTITRINRGPLCLRALSPEEQCALWKELSHLGKLRCGRILTVAPELPASGASMVILAELGFRKLARLSWKSAWIDLGLEPDVFRKHLDGKWRNMLAFAEKSGLQLKIETDDGSFLWMLERYQDLMRDKKFTGPPIGFLRALRESLDDKSRLLILRALAGGEPVAGICLICHGASATYLLGWNGDKGRSLKANHYLLWAAVMQLKKLGLRWFDLGGVSEEQTPGIAGFKLGLNGERYELVGEYWRW